MLAPYLFILDILQYACMYICMYTHKCYSSLKVTKVKTGTCAFKGPIDATMRCHQRFCTLAKFECQHLWMCTAVVSVPTKWYGGVPACAIDWHQQFTRQARESSSIPPGPQRQAICTSIISPIRPRCEPAMHAWSMSFHRRHKLAFSFSCLLCSSDGVS
jgi:hypothetical protein